MEVVEVVDDKVFFFLDGGGGSKVSWFVGVNGDFCFDLYGGSKEKLIYSWHMSGHYNLEI